MYADREGRFEWRPRALKAVILPYWDGDFEAAMLTLAAADFILRYEVDGKVYGWCRRFLKHQTPNPKEPPSTLPAPPSDCSQTRIFTRDNPSSARVPDSGNHESKPKVAPAPTQKVSSGNGLGPDWERKGTDPSRVCVREELPPVGKSPDLDSLHSVSREELPGRVQTRFRKLYLERFGTDPGAGARSAADFPERLANTARAQNVTVDDLLARTFKQWADEGRPGAREGTAYGAYASRFDKYVAPPPAGFQATQSRVTPASLRAEAEKALLAGDMERVKKLTVQAEELELQESRRGR
jgi:hypothetical protein